MYQQIWFILQLILTRKSSKEKTYISQTTLVKIQNANNSWYYLMKYLGMNQGKPSIFNILTMIMQIYIAHWENSTFYLLPFTYVLLRPLCILCHSLLRGRHPSQINSLGSMQAHHLTWGSTSLSFTLFNVAFTHTLTHGR